MGSNIANFQFIIGVNHKIFFNQYLIFDMLYSFELQMMGVILLTAMTVGGISLWIKRRKLRKELEKSSENDEAQNI